MALSTAAALALAGAAIASGVGGGLAAESAADATRDAAKEQALGPIRGGTKRAEGAGGLGPDMSTLVGPAMTTFERMGQATTPIRSPVYGNPINFEQLFEPKRFGAGYSLNNNPSRRFV